MSKAGRRRQSPIWDFFDYDSEGDASKCLVENKEGKVCGTKLKGKNPTNLKSHLRSTHKEAYSSFLSKEAASAPEETPQAVKPKTITECFNRPNSYWLVNSTEHSKREEALVDIFIETGATTQLCNARSFQRYSSVMEPRFKTPKAARVNKLIISRFEDGKKKLKGIIADARKVTLSLDGWSKRGLTAAFMGISACFYHPPTDQVYHALLNLHRMQHPHTGESISLCIDETM